MGSGVTRWLVIFFSSKELICNTGVRVGRYVRSESEMRYAYSR